MSKFLTKSILIFLISMPLLADQMSTLTLAGNTASQPVPVTAKVHENITLKANYTFHLCNSADGFVKVVANSVLKDNEGHIVNRQDYLIVGGKACSDLATNLYFPQQYHSAGLRQLIASAEISQVGLRSENTAPINIIS